MPEIKLDPYRHYPEEMRGFTVEQLKIADNWHRKELRAIEEKHKREIRRTINAHYFGLIPVVCIAGVFSGGYYFGLVELLFSLPALAAVFYLVYGVGTSAYTTINKEKMPGKLWGSAQIVIAFAVCWFAARLIFAITV